MTRKGFLATLAGAVAAMFTPGLLARRQRTGTVRPIIIYGVLDEAGRAQLAKQTHLRWPKPSPEAKRARAAVYRWAKARAKAKDRA